MRRLCTWIKDGDQEAQSDAVDEPLTPVECPTNQERDKGIILWSPHTLRCAYRAVCGRREMERRGERDRGRGHARGAMIDMSYVRGWPDAVLTKKEVAAGL